MLGSGGSLVLDPTLAQPGDSIQCTATVSDAYGASDSTAVSVMVENTAPVSAGVSLTPLIAYNDSTLSCAVSASDADSQALTESWSWSNLSSGAVLGSGANLTLDSALASPGDEIACTVVVSDGDLSVSDSSSVTLDNRPPNQPVVAISPDPATSLNILQCLLNSAIDPDGDVVTASYEWYVNSVLSPAQTSATYGGSIASGDVVACSVVLSDGSLSSTPGLASLTVINNPPVVDSLLLAPAPLRTADALTATVVASDADGDAVTLDYEWSVNGVVVQSGASNSLARR